MKTPTKIFIGFFDEDGVPFENPLWCEQSGFEEDTEYIRRDLVEEIIRGYITNVFSFKTDFTIDEIINNVISKHE